jgi:hypothetical protein
MVVHGGRSAVWRMRSSKVLVVIIILVVVFHGQSSHFRNDLRSPSLDGLSIVDTVHPHGQGLLWIGSGHQRALEAKMEPTGQRKGLLDLTERGWMTRLVGFGSQEDVRLNLQIAIFGQKVPASAKKEGRRGPTKRTLVSHLSFHA